MGVIKKCFAVLLYLLLMSFCLRFDMAQLFDWKQIGLVLIGTAILYLPHLRSEVSRLDSDMIGQSALLSSMIACFVLLFMALSGTPAHGNIFPEVARSCRPLFYGFCIWAVLLPADRREGRGGEGERRNPTLEECREILRELGLTKREAEVSLLVMQGMTNGEIAQELFISETTVKKHLSNIFAKLDIKSREALRGKVLEHRT